MVEMYERILDRNPRDMDALKVVLYGKMKKGLPGVGEVVECVERLIQIEPEELEWRLLQALAYDSMGELEKSKLLFRNILDKSPFLIRALHVSCFYCFLCWLRFSCPSGVCVIVSYINLFIFGFWI